MDVETAIRGRRTHKAFSDEPLSREQLEGLLELAGWAPNHHLTAPWRFRVLGPASLARLKAVAGPEGAAKLDRCPTLVVVSCRLGEDPVQAEEDLHATAVAAYIVLLAAHARGLAGYWRTLALLDAPAVRAALAIDPDEQPIGLLHLGRPHEPQRVPDRAAVDEIATFLD